MAIPYITRGAQYFSVENGNTVASNVVTEANGASLEGYAAGYLPGLSGSYFSTPDSVANSITGDIDIRVKVAMADWTPAAQSALVSKWNAGGNEKAFDFVNSGAGGTLRLYISTTGADTANVLSSVATGFTDGTLHWVRVTRQQSSGDTKFYTSDDGQTWTQLGTTQTLSAGSAMFDATAVVEVGTDVIGTNAPLTGSIYRAQIYNGINGTLAVDYNPRDWSTGSTFTSSGTGEVWTLNGGAQVLKNTILGASVEEARAQLLTSPDTFAATWAAVGTPTITAGSGRCGDILVDLIGDDDAGVLEGYTQAVVYTADAVKQISFKVKVGTSTSTMVRLRDTTAPADRLLVAITWSGGVPTATYTTGTSERATEALGNGFYRIFALTSSVTAVNVHSLEVYPASDAALDVAATGNVLIGGFDTTNAPVATSHIIAVGTRNADSCTHTLGTEFNAVEGTCVAEVSASSGVSNPADQYIAEFSDGTANEMMGIRRIAINGLLGYHGIDGGVTQVSLNSGAATVDLNTLVKGAFTYKLNDSNIAFKGVAGVGDAACTIPTVTTLYIGRYGAGSSQLNGHIKSLTYIPFRESNVVLQAVGV